MSLTPPEQLALDFDSAQGSLPLPTDEPSPVEVYSPGSVPLPENVQLPCNYAADGFTLCPQPGVNGHPPPPIPYQLKVSAKARQVYLRVEPGRGLQVTIPKRYAKRSIPALVESQRSWITEALIDLDKKTPAIYRQWPPPQLELHMCETMVNVGYTHTPNADMASATWKSSSQLHVQADTDNKPLVATCIAGALKPKAKLLLAPWLEDCARRSGLHYKRLMIRGQRTVWGSYSSSGTLSLNYKLLFLKPDVVDYVLLHELAHTKHLDHSPAFWQFVSELKPHALELDQELKNSGELVPPWLELVGKP